MSWQRVDLVVDDPREVYGIDPQELVEALGIERPAWHAEAACRGQGPELWFPANGEPTAEALELCQGCPVHVECFAAGLIERHGVWAGTSEEARRRLRRPGAA